MIQAELKRDVDDRETLVFLAENLRRAGRVWFLLLGYGAFEQGQQANRFAVAVAQHVGNSEQPAFLMHIGSAASPLQIGSSDVYGAVATQRRSLERFVTEAASLLGAYGSWWGESFNQIRTTMDQFDGYAMTVLLFQDSALRQPLEWDNQTVGDWLEWRRRRWGDLKDEIIVVSRTPAARCFSVCPYVDRAKLDEWLQRAPELGSSQNSVRLELRRTDGKDIPEPTLVVPGATVSTRFEGICVIDLPRPALSGQGRIEVARLQVALADLKYVLR